MSPAKMASERSAIDAETEAIARRVDETGRGVGSERPDTVLDESDRIAPFPPAKAFADLPSDGSVLEERMPFVDLRRTSLEASLGAWSTASRDEDYLAYCDAELYRAFVELSERLVVLNDRLHLHYLAQAVKDGRAKQETLSMYDARLGSISYGFTPAGTEVSKVTVADRVVSDDGKKVSLTLQILTKSEQGTVNFMNPGRITVNVEHEETVKALVEDIAWVAAAKGDVVAASRRGLTRMVLKSLKAQYFVLFAITYVLAAIKIVLCLVSRSLRGCVFGILNLGALLLLLSYEPILFLATQLIGFDVLWIESGAADVVCTIAIGGTFAFYTSWYLWLRSLWPLVRPRRLLGVR